VAIFVQDDETVRIRQICVISEAESGIRQVPIATVQSGSKALALQVARLLHVPLLRSFKPKRRVRKRWRRKRA
jgi:hypothetical protein